LRKEVVEEAEREAKREAAKIPAVPAEAAKTVAPPPSAETPKRAPAFENLVRMLGSNAAMVLGAYADPRTGQPVIDPEAARELIDMLDLSGDQSGGCGRGRESQGQNPPVENTRRSAPAPRDDWFQRFHHAFRSAKSHGTRLRHIHGCSHAWMPLPCLQVERFAR
jgi:pyruvate/2-oxoglutarate dehydrogenase complex dihydrolipoamide acyltransferase (E2) component